MSTVDEAVSGSNMPVDPARKAGKKDEEGFDNAETPLPSDMATSGNDVGLFIRILTRWPLTVVSVIFLIMMALLFGVGLPEFQSPPTNGWAARSSLASKEWDAFVWARAEAMDYMRDGGTGQVVGQRFAPLTQEVGMYRMAFYFQSYAGDIFSENNLKSVMNVLNAVNDDVLTAEYCYKGEAGDACQPPWTLMGMLKEHESGKLKKMMKNKKVLPGVASLLKLFVGADADSVEGTASWMQGYVRLGGPLPGYHNTSHLEEEQLQKYKKEFQVKGLLGDISKPGGWITKIDDVITKEQEANPDLKVYWGGGFEMLFARIFTDFDIDISMSVLSLILVGIFMWVQTGSVFLAFTGMFAVFMSFGITLPTWKIFGNQTYTFLQMMVIYIVLGVGADDIFVFCDAWKQSRAHPKASKSIEMRMQWSWSRAMKAMSVTSLTTGSAFVFTSLSDIPAISAFGTFAAVVIAWVYILTISWFPACVVIHEKYVVQAKWPAPGFFASHCCGCMLPICGHQWGLQGVAVTPATNSTNDNADIGTVVTIKLRPTLKRGSTFKNVKSMRAVERFFHTTWTSFLKRKAVRVIVISVFTLAFIVGAVLACTKVELTKKSYLEGLLKKGHPLQKSLNLLMGVDPAFKATDDDFKQLGHWVYGLDTKTPIDRSGTNPLGNGPEGKEIEFENSFGVTKYNGQDLTSPAFQEKIIEDCDKIEKLSSVYKANAESPGQIFCFMQDFKRYIQDEGKIFPVARESLVDELRAWQKDQECTRSSCYWNILGTGVTQGRKMAELYDLSTGFDAEGKEIKFAYISANLTTAIHNFDMATIVPDYKEWRNSALSENDEDKASGIEAIGLTGRVEWIENMDALIIGLVQAIPASVALSFVVLTVTTCNWKVAALATVTIIGILGSFFITFVAQAQTLGFYTTMFLSLLAGFAVDYVVHFAHAFNESGLDDREDKMQHALASMGVSILSGAISTLLASSMLFACSFNFFYLFGSFIFFVILWSLLWAMCFFPAIMMTIGPNNDSGEILWLRKLYGESQGHPRVLIYVIACIPPGLTECVVASCAGHARNEAPLFMDGRGSVVASEHDASATSIASLASTMEVSSPIHQTRSD